MRAPQNHNANLRGPGKRTLKRFQRKDKCYTVAVMSGEVSTRIERVLFRKSEESLALVVVFARCVSNLAFPAPRGDRAKFYRVLKSGSPVMDSPVFFSVELATLSSYQGYWNIL